MRLSELYPSEHLGPKVIEVTALVMSRTEMRPCLRFAVWKCLRCGSTQNMKVTSLKRARAPYKCLSGEDGGCNRSSTGFDLVDSKDVDEQWIELVEPSEEMKGSRPKTLRARLEGKAARDVIDIGDYVTVLGYLKREDEPAKDGSVKVSPSVYLDVKEHQILNRVELDITPEEARQIKAVAKLPNPLFDAIVPSIAPKIVGMDYPKAGLACVLFGGVDAEGAGLRGRSHMFMVGDPGTAKTKLQKAGHRIMPRSQYATIPGATEVGLTAALVRDPNDGKYHLEAGVLPLAHGSVALIDECGQATPEQWKSMEECMETGWVTRSGGGRHGRLKAMTSLICAANPKDGSRWEEHESIQDQIKIPDSTLDRFDLVFLIPDDPENDAEIREHIDKHHGHGGEVEPPPMDEALLSKYIARAQKVRPRPSEEAVRIFHEAHKVIRAIEDANFGIRAYEGYYRLGEAIARMSLSQTIAKEHADLAVKIHHAGWELLIKQKLEDHETMPQSQQERIAAVLELVREHEKIDGVPYKKLRGEASKIKISDVELTQALKRLHDDGKVIEKRPNTWGVA